MKMKKKEIIWGYATIFVVMDISAADTQLMIDELYEADISRKTSECLIITPVCAAIYPDPTIYSFHSVSNCIEYLKKCKLTNQRVVIYNHTLKVYMSIYFGSTGSLHIDYKVFSIHRMPTSIQPFPTQHLFASGCIVNLSCGEIVDSYDNGRKLRGVDNKSTRNSLIHCAMVERNWYESDDIIIISDTGHLYYFDN